MMQGMHGACWGLHACPLSQDDFQTVIPRQGKRARDGTSPMYAAPVALQYSTATSRDSYERGGLHCLQGDTCGSSRGPLCGEGGALECGGRQRHVCVMNPCLQCLSTVACLCECWTQRGLIVCTIAEDKSSRLMSTTSGGCSIRSCRSHFGSCIMEGLCRAPVGKIAGLIGKEVP